MSRFDHLSAYLEQAIRSWSCPGAAVAVIQGDDVLHREIYGLRDIEHDLPLTLDTRFAMGSVTKSVTAMSIALLVDDGQLDWDMPVREYMPEFILDDEYVSKHVTIRDMLSHRTGLARHDLAAWRLDIPLSEFIKRMRYLKLSTSFRERCQYNNLMYTAAAYLIEKVTGQSWEHYAQARIFQPLGMIASNFSPEPPLDGQVTAQGYRVDQEEDGAAKGLIPMRYRKHTPISPGAAGALFSTLADMTRWLGVHINGGKVGETQLICCDTLRQMHLPQIVLPVDALSEALFGTTIGAYGMGWRIGPYRGYTLAQHGGDVEGFSVIVGFVPEERVGVIGLTNIQGRPLRDVILYESLDRALGLPENEWNARFHAVWDPLLGALGQGKQTSRLDRIPDAPPTHALADFQGVYAADGYPDFAVMIDGTSLKACTVGSLDWSMLRHYHYDVFEWHLEDDDAWIKVRFLMNEFGQIDSASIPIEPTVDNVIFKRRPIEIPQEIVAELVGEYVTSIPGVDLKIASRNGRLYVIETGGPAEEVKPYTLTDALVGFMTSRARFDFVRDGNVVLKVVVKTPAATVEAKRRASG